MAYAKALRMGATGVAIAIAFVIPFVFRAGRRSGSNAAGVCGSVGCGAVTVFNRVEALASATVVSLVVLVMRVHLAFLRSLK